MTNGSSGSAPTGERPEMMTADDAEYVERLAVSDGNIHDQAFYRRVLATYHALAAAQADSRRLDYLERRLADTTFDGLQWAVEEAFKADDLRAALDHAMTQETQDNA